MVLLQMVKSNLFVKAENLWQSKSKTTFVILKSYKNGQSPSHPRHSGLVLYQMCMNGAVCKTVSIFFQINLNFDDKINLGQLFLHILNFLPHCTLGHPTSHFPRWLPNKQADIITDNMTIFVQEKKWCSAALENTKSVRKNLPLNHGQFFCITIVGYWIQDIRNQDAIKTPTNLSDFWIV
jgi:hypothetical protein